jgi:uncharacterized protein (UPF0303 family)
MMDINEGIAILERQEEELQFSHFNRQDVWKLGKELVSKILEENLPLSVSIRLPSGFTLFQYAAEGTTPNSGYWMDKKFNIVREMEISSLLNTLRLQKGNQTLEDRGLDSRVYAWGGGGFPVRVRGAGLVAVAVASGLPHLRDHDILVEGIAKVLRLKEASRLPLDAGF